jgi:BNR repeat protein
MRTAALLVLSLVAAGDVRAQTIRVGAVTEVARETDPRRFSEPHLAVHPANPRHLLATAWHASLSDSSAAVHQSQRCSSFVSRDAGATWTRHDFPLVDCFDPQVAITPDGQAVFLAGGIFEPIVPARNTWLVVYHSADGGVTWDDKPTIVGHGHDHPAVVVDLGSPARKGWIYVSSHYQWRDGNSQLQSSVFVARSRDGGKTFDSPVETSPTPLHNVSEMPVVLSDGTIVASFVDSEESGAALTNRRAWVIRSSDGATTFSRASHASDQCGPPPPFQLSALAVDASNGPLRDRLYFACRQSGGGPIVVTSSADRGATWNRPGVAVGPDTPGKDVRRVASLAVNGAGVVGVLIVERKPNPSQCLEVTFSASFDGGATFGAPQRVSSSPCGDSPTDAVAARLFPTYGDYYGIVALPDGSFRVMWPQLRSGVPVLLTTLVEVAGR